MASQIGCTTRVVTSQVRCITTVVTSRIRLQEKYLYYPFKCEYKNEINTYRYTSILKYIVFDCFNKL